MKSATIIGGGIIGYLTAYYLNKEGWKVTVLEKNSSAFGCSYGNAGMIVPSHFIPLAAPGIVYKGMKWMFNPRSPFALKLKFDKHLLSWLWKFYRLSTEEHVKKHMILLRDLHLESTKLYNEISKEPDIQMGLDHQGLLMLYNTHEGEKEELEIAEKAETLGLQVRNYPSLELSVLEPDIQLDVLGGIHYLSDSHINPGKLMNSLYRYLENRGVEFVYNAHLKNILYKDQKVLSVITGDAEYKSDEYLITAGVWTSQLVRNLGYSIPLQAGKGYSFDVKVTNGETLRTPTILTEAKVAITPFQGSIRFAGTMEISSVSENINRKRVEGIVRSIKQYMPDFHYLKAQELSIWHGLRPVSPDGLPYIGRINNLQNLSVGTGHAMMGVSLAPITGKLLSDMLNDKSPVMNISALDPLRFS